VPETFARPEGERRTAIATRRLDFDKLVKFLWELIKHKLEWNGSK